jgi:hypothetical protein
LHTEIQAAAKTAHQENIGIYMQPVPDSRSVPRIEGKRMVSPKEPSEMLNRNEQWFADIVPDKVTRNFSRCGVLCRPQLRMLKMPMSKSYLLMTLQLNTF